MHTIKSSQCKDSISNTRNSIERVVNIHVLFLFYYYNFSLNVERIVLLYSKSLKVNRKVHKKNLSSDKKTKKNIDREIKPKMYF